jgi:hypothetical protein
LASLRALIHQSGEEDGGVFLDSILFSDSWCKVLDLKPFSGPKIMKTLLFKTTTYICTYETIT